MRSFAALTLLLAIGTSALDSHSTPVSEVCTQIAKAVSSESAVFHPGDVQYADDIHHYAVTSSMNATCSVEPGTAEDVGTILRILGKTRTKFAVKGAGHSMQPGGSSTTGVQIAMSRFNDTVYDAQSQTAVVGAGKIWDDVYADLAPHGVVVVGGRVPGVGVAGLSLGGGYSYISNQYGLAFDNIVAYELVLPNGTVTTVTAESYPDLSFALKGGFNNFGIVTKFTMKTYPQGLVWAGFLQISADHFDEVTAATAAWTNADPKSAAIMEYTAVNGKPGAALLLFYNAPTPPDGLFDAFLRIPALPSSQRARTMTYVEWIAINADAAFPGMFTYTLSVDAFTTPFLEATANETLFWGEALAAASCASALWIVEPFGPGILTHAPEGSSAWPPTRARPSQLYLLLFQFTDPGAYARVRAIATASGEQVAHSVRGALGAPYPNYADDSTAVERMYGKNLPRLRAVRRRYDPEDVMGLAGGWKF